MPAQTLKCFSDCGVCQGVRCKIWSTIFVVE
jgi:hypothetical protein